MVRTRDIAMAGLEIARLASNQGDRLGDLPSAAEVVWFGETGHQRDRSGPRGVTRGGDQEHGIVIRGDREAIGPGFRRLDPAPNPLNETITEPLSPDRHLDEFGSIRDPVEGAGISEILGGGGSIPDLAGEDERPSRIRVLLRSCLI